MTATPNVADRTIGLGGTDASAILGCNPYKSAVDVYLETIGEKPPEPENLRMKLGTLAEPMVAELYTQATGRRVFKVNQTLRHPEHEFITGHIDRRVQNDGEDRRILECKTAWPSPWQPEAWDRWGDTGTDEVPDHYLVQVQHYLSLVPRAQQCDLAALIGGDFRIYHIERDPQLIDHIVGRLATFWHQHIVPRTPPEPTTPEDVAALFPRNNGTVLEADAELVQTLAQYRELDRCIKEAETEKKRLRTIITGAIGEADGICLPGQAKPAITWKAQTRQGLDAKRLGQDHPDLVAEYQRPTTFRVLRTTKALDALGAE